MFWLRVKVRRKTSRRCNGINLKNKGEEEEDTHYLDSINDGSGWLDRLRRGQQLDQGVRHDFPMLGEWLVVYMRMEHCPRMGLWEPASQWLLTGFLVTMDDELGSEPMTATFGFLGKTKDETWRFKGSIGPETNFKRQHEGRTHSITKLRD